MNASLAQIAVDRSAITTQALTPVAAAQGTLLMPTDARAAVKLTARK